MSIDRSRPPGIKLHQVFLESAHFEHRADFLAHPPSTPVEDLDIDFEVEFAIDAEDATKAALRATVRTSEDDALYKFAVSIGAVVEQDKANANFTIPDYIATSSAALLVPFLREAVANITGRGRFGPIWLHPMNMMGLSLSGTSAPAADRAEPAEPRRHPRKRAKK